jgi:hypothetical protein
LSGRSTTLRRIAAPGTPAQRLAIAMSLSRVVRELAVAGIRSAHPNASKREVQAELAARMYGQEVAKRLFGPRVV